MPREISPSSYECDCGHLSHFFENTIREAKAKSHRQPIRLGDSTLNEHFIIFHRGKMVNIVCPQNQQADDRL